MRGKSDTLRMKGKNRGVCTGPWSTRRDYANSEKRQKGAVRLRPKETYRLLKIIKKLLIRAYSSLPK